MGIPELQSLVIKRFFPNCIVNDLPVVDILAIDLNSLLHGVWNSFFGDYSDQARKEAESELSGLTNAQVWDRYYNLFVVYVREVNRVIAPTRMFMAVDGIPNRAKMEQQRTRRILHKPHTRDRNSITPYTNFMDYIDKKILDNISVFVNKTTKRVMYSGHNIPEEGEQKILKQMQLRELGEGRLVIYGNDTDLIIINLLQQIQETYIFRELEDTRTGKIIRRRIVISITSLKERILEYLGTPTAVEDFCIMVLMFGNDFMPSIPGLTYFGSKSWHDALANDTDKYSEFGQVMEVYKAGKYQLLEGNQINISELVRLLSNLPYDDMLRIHIQRSQGRKNSYIANIQYENYRNEYYSFIGGDKNTVVDMCLNWLEMYQWTFEYFRYGYGAVNNTSYYKYPYAPLLPDIIQVIRSIKYVPLPETKITINPFAALLLIMPTHSRFVLPTPLDGLVRRFKPQTTVYIDDYKDFRPIIFMQTMELSECDEYIKTHYKKNAIVGEMKNASISLAKPIKYSTVRTVLKDGDIESDEVQEKRNVLPEYLEVSKPKSRYVGKLHL